jgi:hypothetical protein
MIELKLKIFIEELKFIKELKNDILNKDNIIN